ncbi:MAG: sce7726 family protein, partial [Thermoleophilia bacterium]
AERKDFVNLAIALPYGEGQFGWLTRWNLVGTVISSTEPDRRLLGTRSDSRAGEEVVVNGKRAEETECSSARSQFKDVVGGGPPSFDAKFVHRTSVAPPGERERGGRRQQRPDGTRGTRCRPAVEADDEAAEAGGRVTPARMAGTPLEPSAPSALCLHEATHAAVALALGLEVEEVRVVGTMHADELTAGLYGIPVGTEIPAAGTRIPDEYLETHPLELLASMMAPSCRPTGDEAIDEYGAHEKEWAIARAGERGVDTEEVERLARATVTAQEARIVEIAAVLGRDGVWLPKAEDATPVEESPVNDEAIREWLLPFLVRRGGRPLNEISLASNNTRIDVVAMLDGTLCGFEIKSESDTLKRLPAQAKRYKRYFRKLILVVAEGHLEKARELLPGYWGLWVVHSSASGVEIVHEAAPARSPKQNRHQKPEPLAYLMRKAELIDLLGSGDPGAGYETMTRKELARECAERFTIEEIELAVFEALHLRNAARGH